MLVFWDTKKIGETENEKFPLVIIAMVDPFNVSDIFIDDVNSCDIMYLELFEKMDLKNENLWSYEGSDLQACNGTTTCP